MHAAYSGVHTRELIPVIIWVASPIPPRSAAMLITFATISSRHALHKTHRE